MYYGNIGNILSIQFNKLQKVEAGPREAAVRFKKKMVDLTCSKCHWFGSTLAGAEHHKRHCKINLPTWLQFSDQLTYSGPDEEGQETSEDENDKGQGTSEDEDDEMEKKVKQFVRDTDSEMTLGEEDEEEESKICGNNNSPVRGGSDSNSSESLPQRKNTTEEALVKLPAKEDASSNFMADFDPMKSRRERNREKESYSQNPRDTKESRKNFRVFNEKGVHIQSGIDSCDCLREGCQGCHFPCSKCKSTKCGHECRQNRKWQYESIEFEDDPSKKRVNPYVVNAGK